MTQVNEDDRPSPNQVAGELGQALRHDAPTQAINDYRRLLATSRAEKALEKALADAPPLRPEQVSFLRAVVQSYGEDDS